MFDEPGATNWGSLAVGMVTGCTITPLFDALAAFRGAHPGIELALAEDSSDRVAEQVRASRSCPTAIRSHPAIA